MGDKNTSFYHTKSIIRQRSDRHRITKLKDPDGSWITDESQQSALALRHFRDLFSLDNPAPPVPFLTGRFPELSHDSVATLDQPITLQEVREALFDMKPLKAPGADSLHALFYQSQWPTVSRSHHAFIQDLWEGKPLRPSLNKTLIALIPKKPSLSSMSEFRPISLCYVAYKTLTKLVVNRLKEHLPHLVGPCQTRFIQGRSIIDNIIIAQEVVHSTRKKQGKSGWMAIKIDLEKAFDRLRWDFIHETLIDAVSLAI